MERDAVALVPRGKGMLLWTLRYRDRAKWGLPYDYPMVAPSYAVMRRELAKAIGLGRKPAPAPAPKPKRPGGRKKAA